MQTEINIQFEIAETGEITVGGVDFSDATDALDMLNSAVFKLKDCATIQQFVHHAVYLVLRASEYDQQCQGEPTAVQILQNIFTVLPEAVTVSQVTEH